jgi:beta-galactosidase
VQTEITDGKIVLDQVTNRIGFRWFSFDPNQGFFLNGNRYKLRGVNRHQDYYGLGNAVPNELQVKDLETTKQLGFNFLLLAHYPHDPEVLDAAVV